jgi:hypothetical protein
LEFLFIHPSLGDSRLDLDAKYRQNRQERSFNAVYGGSHWTVQLEAQPLNASGPDGNRTKIDLPEEVAAQLGELNRQQREYDRTLQEITSLRQQLFSDWYKYMLCAYPPEGASADYPDIDAVKYYIETQELGPLEDKIRSSSQMAEALKTRVGALQAVIDQHNQQAGAVQYLLRSIPAARYWQPKEPAVLIVDEAEYAILENQARPVDCLFAPGIGREARLSKEELDKILSLVCEQPFFERQAPWHSIFLEWEVAFFPMRLGGNLHPTRRDYSDQFILENYELLENEVELQKKAGQKTVKGAQIYRGYSLLTPAPGIQLKQEIARYLEILNEPQRLQGSLEKDEAFLDWYGKKPKFEVDAGGEGEPLPAGASAEDLESDPAAEPLRGEEFQTWLGERIDSILEWYQQKPGSSNQDQSLDLIFTFLRAFKAIQNKAFLSQVLSGFNDALLMHKQTMQLPIADPLGFQGYRDFAARVRRCIEGENKSAPQPLDDFNPIRAGALNIQHLRLIDTFGRVKELFSRRNPKNTKIIPSEPLRDPANEKVHATLPPRLVQPARLSFRWLAADPGSQAQREMSTHPATHPICGWLLPNLLDKSILVYDQAGNPLGSITVGGSRWQSAPGSRRVTLKEIPNPHLGKVVEYITSRDNSFQEEFITTLHNALENIAPENYRQDIGPALLMGRPVAVVRAGLKLELLGRPAVHQGWNVFRQDLGRETRDTDAFDRVRFPIRLGAETQLDDGLVGCWLEQEDGSISEAAFLASQATRIELPVDQPVQTLTMLLDPRGKVHAASGILPVKTIDIPNEQYAGLLQNLAVTFLVAPILTGQSSVTLPFPVEPGYGWTWVDNERGVWLEKEVNLPKPQEAFSQPQEIREGWLKLKPSENPSTGEPAGIKEH